MRIILYALAVVCLAGSLYGQCSKLAYNPLTGQWDCTSAAGPQGPAGPAGATGPAGAIGAPNTAIVFTAATTVVWAHNENTVDYVYRCYDSTTTPPIEVEPSRAETTDINTITFYFEEPATGFCVANFSGGAGGGNPLWANILAGTNAAALVVGTGGSITTSGSGTVRANVIAPLATGTTLLLTGIAAPTAPSSSSGLGIPFYEVSTRKFCVMGDDGSKSCTGAPGGGSVLSADGSIGQGVETVVSGSVAAITVTGSIRAASLLNVQSGTTYTVLTGDRSKLVVGTNAAAMAWTLPQASSSFPTGWFMDVKNGTSTWGSPITITPTTSTIDGGTAIVVGPGETCRVYSDGTNYTTAGLRAMMPNGVADGTWFAPWGEFHDPTTNGLIATANRVYMFYFQVRDRPIKVGLATFRVLVGSASTHMAMAIYKDVSTKIVETVSATTATNGEVISPALGATTILTPGLYILAYASDSALNSLTTINGFPASTAVFASAPASGSPTFLLREWTCANAASFGGGAIFPSACGAKTLFSTTGPPIMLLEN